MQLVPRKPILIQVQAEEGGVAWYIIKETSTGPKISEIFRGVPQAVEPFNAPLQRNCVFVGSQLYDMGGRGTTRHDFLQFSNMIRVLDTGYPRDGWETDQLPFYCEKAITASWGNFIYFFPTGYRSGFKTTDQSLSPWAYLYDTFKCRAYKLKAPIEQDVSGPPFCGFVRGRLIVPVMPLQSQKTFFFSHDPYRMTWELLSEPMNAPHSAEMWGPAINVTNEAPLSLFLNKPHAIYDSKYFVLCGIFIHAYSLDPWKFCGSILMPKQLDIDHGVDRVFMHFIAEYELAILWHTPYSYDGQSTLHYARILISFCPPAATLLKLAEFDITAIEVVNCLPYFSADYSIEGEDDCLHTRETQVQERSFDASNSKQNKHELQEVDWKERCMYLEEELRRLKQQSHSTQTCRAATTDQPPYKKSKRRSL